MPRISSKFKLVATVGIEPTSAPYQDAANPLSYAAIIRNFLVSISNILNLSLSSPV